MTTGRRLAALLLLVAWLLPADRADAQADRLARPGGSVTGQTCMSAELSPRKLQLFKQAVPGLARIDADKADGLFVCPDAVTERARAEIVRFATRQHVPAQSLLLRADEVIE